jgi:hypothetical protein
MLQNLKMLLSLRAWLKSDTLKTGGAVAVLGAIQAWASSSDGADMIGKVASLLHITGPTLNGIVLGLVGLAMLLARAKTEWSLQEKVDGTADSAIAAAKGTKAPMWLLLLVVPLLASTINTARADVTKTFSWVAPTKNVDGSTLPTSQITGYKLECTPVGPTPITISGPVTSYMQSFTPGTYTCTLRSLANGQQSAPSNAVNFTVPPPVPNPPTMLTVG